MIPTDFGSGTGGSLDHMQNRRCAIECVVVVEDRSNGEVFAEGTRKREGKR
jgi:hypothetical protein